MPPSGDGQLDGDAAGAALLLRGFRSLSGPNIEAATEDAVNWTTTRLPPEVRGRDGGQGRKGG